MAKSKKQKGGGGGLFLSMALGAALAAGAGYYATHKEEVDREAKKKIDELAKLFQETKSQIEPKVRKVWGEVSKESVAKYMDVRGALLHALEDEKVKNAGDLVRDNYDSIVESIVSSAKKSGLLDNETQKKLEKLFKMDWDKVREVMMTSAEVASVVAKKGVKKAKKAVNKATHEVKSKKSATKKKPAKKVAKKSTTKKTAIPKKRKPVKKAAKKVAKKTTAKKVVKKAVKKKR